MKKGLLFFLIIFCFPSCYHYQSLPIIRDPGYPKLILPSVEKTMVAESEIIFLDPTEGYIENQTDNVFVEIWIDANFSQGKPKTSSIFELPPDAIIRTAMPLGKHFIYAKGKVKTQFGWKDLGARTKRVRVANRICGWKISFRQNDFRLY